MIMLLQRSSSCGAGARSQKLRRAAQGRRITSTHFFLAFKDFAASAMVARFPCALRSDISDFIIAMRPTWASDLALARPFPTAAVAFAAAFDSATAVAFVPPSTS